MPTLRMRWVDAAEGPVLGLRVLSSARKPLLDALKAQLRPEQFVHLRSLDACWIRPDEAKRAVEALRTSFRPLWDERILSEYPSAPAPLDIGDWPRWRRPANGDVQEPVRMRMVRDDQLGPAVAVQTRHFHEDFVVELREVVPQHGRRFLEDESVWLISEEYLAHSLEVLDLYFHPHWDTMMLRDWEGLPIPPDTQYPVVSAGNADYRLLGIRRSATLEDVRTAWRHIKERSYSGQVSRERLALCREAYERLAHELGESDS